MSNVRYRTIRARRKRWMDKARLIGAPATTITTARRAWKKIDLSTRIAAIEHLDGICTKDECRWCLKARIAS